MKISVIGAGNVGASTALLILIRSIADVVLYDIVKGMPQGKAIDMADLASVFGINKRIEGTNDISLIAGSDIVVITAGLTRKPGMAREELVMANARIIKDVCMSIKQLCPDAIIITVTNPLDVMTYIAYKVTGFDPKKVIGMAGVLDSARLKTLLTYKLNAAPIEIESMILGGHGDYMVMLDDHVKISGSPVEKFMSNSEFQDLIIKTRDRGAQLVALMGTSAYYGPAASAVLMIESIVNNKLEVLPCSCYVSGQYGINGIYIGVPAALGKGGVEKIIELKLTDEKQAALNRSAQLIKETIQKVE